MWAIKLGGHQTTRERRDAHGARLRAKRRAVIELHPLLVLPLMHHLVNERAQRFVESMAHDVTAADHDLGRITGLGGGGVMAKPGAHATRDPHADRSQLACESLGV